MFLMGIIMVSTGVCLILNYGYFDNALFPPELQSQEGKRTVGIILTVSGFAAVFISVLVSSIYLCSRSKTPSVHSDELNQIPNSGRKSSAGSRNKVASADANTASGKHKNSSHTTLSASKHQNKNKDMHSTAVPRQRHPRKRKKQRIMQRSKLEGIQEADAISRKFSEKEINTTFEFSTNDDVHSENYSQETTFVGVETQDDVFQEHKILVSSSNSVVSSEDLPHIDNPAFSDVPKGKNDFDQSSTSSGFTGSEKTDSLHRVEGSLDHPV